jgi:iron complex transport system substrate-binding protein
MRKKWTTFSGIALLCMAMLTGCGKTETATGQKDTDISPELTYSSSLELTYAEEFSVDYYEDGYTLLTIAEDGRYLVVPEGESAPEELDEDIVVLQQPIENIYLAASAVMDMFVSIDGLDHIRFSGLDTESWYIEPAKEAMESGDIIYAGKYSAPDYEQILAGNCGLAIENTMIYHTPEVKEQLEKFNIPILVDYSSYEPEPLGRTEWVKLYGVLTGEEEKAAKVFDDQVKAFASVEGQEKTDKTVAFFYISSNGEVNVRKSSDYLPKMIEMAGGTYIFDDLGDDDDTASSTVTMQMEEFYLAAKDADYIIYNSTVDGELTSVEELVSKNSLLANLKAVQEGNVFCTTKNLYQSSMELGTMIADIHGMLKGEEEELTYIYKLTSGQ